MHKVTLRYIKLIMSEGCRTGPSGYVGWRPGTRYKQPYTIVDFIPLSGTMNLSTEEATKAPCCVLWHSAGSSRVSSTNRGRTPANPNKQNKNFYANNDYLFILVHSMLGSFWLYFVCYMGHDLRLGFLLRNYCKFAFQ